MGASELKDFVSESTLSVHTSCLHNGSQGTQANDAKSLQKNVPSSLGNLLLHCSDILGTTKEPKL